MTAVRDKSLHVRSIDEPDEHNEFPLVSVDSSTIGGVTFVRITAQPGWRWSTSVGPTAGTATCQAPHTGYVIRGRLGIRMDTGPEAELVAGDVFTCDPGHDGWVVGDEPLEFLEVVPNAG